MDKNKKMSKVTKGVIAAVSGIGLAATLVPTVKVVAGNNTDECYITVDYNIPGLENGKIKVEKNTQVKDLKLEPVEGYMFKGWFKDEACTERYKSTEVITADSVVFAKLEVATYAVVFPTSDYFEISTESKIVEYGTDVKFTITVPEGAQDNRVVEVNGDVILPDANGVYTIMDINSNTVVTVDGIIPAAGLTLNVDGVAVKTISTGDGLTYAQAIEAANLQYNEYNTCGWYLDSALTQVADLNEVVQGVGCLYTRTVTEEMLEALNLQPLSQSGVQVMSMTLGASALEETQGNTAIFTIDQEVTLSEIVIPEKVKINGVDYTVVTGGFDTGNTNVTQIALPTTMKTTLIQEEVSADRYGVGGGFARNSTLTFLNLHDKIEHILPCSFAGYVNLPIDLSTMKSLKTIGNLAFYVCSALTSLTIPETVTSIGEFSFVDCAFLEEIYWNAIDCHYNVVNSVYREAFNDSGTINGIKLVIGKNVEHLPDEVFTYGAYGNGQAPRILEVYILGNKLQTIGESTFSFAENTVIYYIGSETEFSNIVYENWNGNKYSITGLYSIQNCQKIYNYSPNIKFLDGIVYYVDEEQGIYEVVGLENTELTEIVISSEATSIAAEAFSGNESIQSIVIPESVQSIGYEAFSNCTALQEITIPAGITYISYGMFNGCSELTTVNYGGSEEDKAKIFIDENNEYLTSAQWICQEETLFEVVEDVIYYKDQTNGIYELIGLADQDITELVISPNTTAIAEGAFVYNETLKSVTIPASVREIGPDAFYSCTALETVIFEEDSQLEKIDEWAFYYCTALQNITIPDNVKTIAEGAFCECYNLKEVSFSENSQLKIIGDDAFGGCSSLQSITVPKNVTSIGEEAFGYCSILEEINLNAEKLDNIVEGIFNNSGEDTENGITVNFGENVTNVPEYLFADCYLNTVNLNNVSCIGKYAFAGSSVRTLTIPESVKQIGGYAFAECSSLQTLNWNVTNLETQLDFESLVFQNTGSNLEVIFGEDVKEIPSHIFYQSNVKTVNFNTISSIGEYSFFKCSGLESVVIPQNVEYIGYQAFSDCSALKSVSLQDCIVNIQGFAFSDCYNLQEIDWNIKQFTNSSGTYIFSRSGRDYLNGVSVSFGENISEIPNSLFSGTNIKTVNLEGIISIGEGAFDYCTNLTDVIMSEGITNIGSRAFEGCSALESISIPQGVNSIGASAFSSCYSLLSVSIPESVTSIGKLLFSGCTALQTIQWNVIKLESTISYDSYVFYNAGKAHANGIVVNFGENVEEIPDYLFYGDGSSSSYYPRIKTVNFAQNSKIKKIERNTFSYCKDLTALSIPEGVEDLYLYNLAGLTNLQLPNNLQNLTISNCSALTQLTIPENVTNLSITGTGISTIEIPENVTTLNLSGFNGIAQLNLPNTLQSLSLSGFNGLTQIEIPASVTNLSLKSCEKLKTVTFAENSQLQSIQDRAFDHCGVLESIVIPANVSSIKSYAFAYCSALNSITLPISLMEVGSYAFQNCNKLTNVYYVGTQDDWNKISISSSYNTSLTNATKTYSCDSEKLIEIDNVRYYKESEQSYIALGLVNTTATSISLHENTKSIKANAFSDCTTLTSITIPEGVTSIGKYAFSGCSGVEILTWNVKKLECDLTSLYIFENIGSSTQGTTVKFGANVEEVPSNLFYGGYSGSQKVKTVEFLGSKVESIGSLAFYSCSQLTSIDIPDSVTSLDYSAFSNSGLTSIEIIEGTTILELTGCSGLTSIDIPDSVTSLTLSSCSGLTSINIPASVTSLTLSSCSGLQTISFAENSQLTSIQNSAFSYCSNLKNITLPEGVTSLGNNAFQNCSALTSIEIPNSVTSIGNYAFRNCSALTSIEIPNSVTSIGQYAFYNCEKLTNIVIPEGITTIEQNTFQNCSKLESITLPVSLTTINYSAFSYCSNLTTVNYGGLSEDHQNMLINNENDNLKDAIWIYKDGSTNQQGKSETQVINGIIYSINEEQGIFEAVSLENNGITDLVFDYRTTSIAEYAFSGCSFTSVTIPENVTFIGESAFSNCSNLQTVYYNAKRIFYDPDGLGRFFESSGSNSGTGIKAVFGENVESVPGGLFYQSNVTKVEFLGNKVTYISNYAFSNCSGLTSIDIPDSVAVLGVACLSGTSITNIQLPKDLMVIEDSAFSSCEQLESITIPENVIRIGMRAFSSSNIKRVAFEGNSKISILSEGVFGGCYNLKEIYLPKSVKYIRNSAFSSCNNLTTVLYQGTEEDLSNITVESDNSSLTNANWVYNSFIDNGVAYCLDEESGMSVALGLTEYTATSITLREDTIAIIGDFTNSSIKTIVIPDSVQSIGEGVFRDSLLYKVTIGANVQEIGEGAFSGCFTVEVINKSQYIDLAETGDGSLYQTIGLQMATVISSESESDAIVEDNVIYYQVGEDLAAFDVVDKTATSIKLNKNTTVVNYFAFADCKNLQSIIIPKTLRFVGHGALMGCESLAEIYYEGTQQESLNIQIEDDSIDITKLTFNYNYVYPTEE